VGHPLFAAASRSSKRPEIGFVQVRRREQGQWKRAPETFAAADLADRKALEERFGGGEYELVARCERNHRITTRARVSIPGEPKPLGESEDVDGPEPRRTRRPIASARLIALFEEGRLQARVFRMFERGCDVSEIVRVTKLPIEEVRRLWNERRKPLDTEISNAADAYQREADVFDERRVARERMETERKRVELAHERERKRLELVERALKLRERELELARTRALPEMDPANEKLLETLISSLLPVAQGSPR
jgi:hypothetical protein